MLTPINIIQHPVLGPAVSGRELYKLTSNSKSDRDGFSDWFRTRQAKLTLTIGVDFVESTAPHPDPKSVRKVIEFIMSLPTAKAFCGLATSGRGDGVLSFIEAYELNPAIAAVVEAPQPYAAPIESLFSKVVNSQEGAFDQLKQLKPGVQVTVAPAPIETPTVALTPAQLRLKQAQEELEQLQREVEEEAKQQSEVAESMPGTSDELFTLLDNRIDSIEGKVNVMLTFFEQATTALRGMSSISVAAEVGSTEVAEPTTRTLLVRLVNSFAAAERRSEHETWKYLYGQFDLRTGLNAYAVAPNKTRDQSYLTVIEERGQIDKLYELARKLLVLPELR